MVFNPQHQHIMFMQLDMAAGTSRIYAELSAASYTCGVSVGAY